MYIQYSVKLFEWNESKNSILKLERSISFEEILTAIENGFLLDIIEHPNSKKYYSK